MTRSHPRPAALRAMLYVGITLTTGAACAPAVAPVTSGTQFYELDVVQAQGDLCADTQGTWFHALLACACPAETLFHPEAGCRPMPPWAAVPDPAGLHLLTFHAGHLAVRIDPPQMGGKAAKAAKAPLDPAAFYIERITLPTRAGSHVLTHALAQDIDAAYHTWVLGTLGSGPKRSLWYPLHARLPSIKKACRNALGAYGLQHGPALCDIAESIQREVRKRGAPRKRAASAREGSVWDSVEWEALPAPPAESPESPPESLADLQAAITALWRSRVAAAEYVVHLQDDGAVQRHIRVVAGGEQLVLFMDATGRVVAGVVCNLERPPGRMQYFDAYWHRVIPDGLTP